MAQKQKQGFLSQVKFGDSYTSLIVGVVVVIAVGLLAFGFIQARRSATQQDTSSSATQTQEEGVVVEEDGTKYYTVKKGDDLWGVAESVYKSGYNWVDIAQENNLVNPNRIEEGQRLIIPDVEPKTPTAEEATEQDMTEETAMDETEGEGAAQIAGDSHTVVKGDHLWSIAERAYGDGYRWVDIAKANNLANPNLIHAGNELTLPRE